MKSTQALLVAIVILLSLHLVLGLSLPARGQNNADHQSGHIKQDRLPLKSIGMNNNSLQSQKSDQQKEPMIKTHAHSPCVGMSTVLDPRGKIHLFRIFRDGIVEKYDGKKWTEKFELNLRK